MKVAVDYRALQSGYADHGVGTFARNVLSRLSRSSIGSSLVYCGRSAGPAPQGAAYRAVHRPRWRSWFWEQVLWPIDLAGMGASVFVSPVSLGMVREIGFPVWTPGRRIAIVHDLNSFAIPEFQWWTRTLSFRVNAAAVRRAHAVLTVSNFVRSELVARLGVPANRVRVIPEGVDDRIREIFDARSLPAARAERFILGMGEGPHKNIGTVIRVFGRVVDRGYGGRLRIVGRLEHQTREVRNLCEAARHRDRIGFTGAIPASELVELYARCDLFLFPSLCEGFGLPVLEAMYCGAPVVTSNTTSLPEVGGDAALCCDPANVAALAAATWQLTSDSEFRAAVSGRGRTRAAHFSWDAAVETIAAVCRQLA